MTGRARIALASAALGAAVIALVLCLRAVADDPPKPAPPPPPPPPPAQTSSVPPESNSAAAPVEEPAPEPPSPTISVVITVVPARTSTVYWGRHVLGTIAARSALVVQRPRDSGPLDLMIRSPGYLPVQTRAYTFNDTKLSVKLTPLDQKSTLLGYKQEVVPDAGTPLLPTATPAAPVTSDVPQ
jgi:hypothetical protein